MLLPLQSLLFEGCLDLQVLTGLLHVHGYTVTPSHPPLPLFSTTHSSHLPITAIDPHSVRSRHLQPMVDCLCKPVVKFVASGFNLEKTSSVVVCDDFDLDDIRWLNSLRGVAIACVCGMEPGLTTGIVPPDHSKVWITESSAPNSKPE